MTPMNDENKNLNGENQGFDPLDMSNYKVEKLPKMQKSSVEIWLSRLGIPLAIIAFVAIYFSHIGFIDNLKGWRILRSRD